MLCSEGKPLSADGKQEEIMERREVLGLAAMAAMAAAVGHRAAAQPAPGKHEARIIRVYADKAGESHIEELPVAANAEPLPVTGVRLNRYAPSTNDWHTPRNGTFAINTEGKLEVEVSTGAKRVIGPGDLVYIGDTHGKGHVTKLLTPVTNLFITVDPAFDVISWAAGKA
jgi:hypothetical protein